jgi:hypothetical protein
LTPRLLPTLDDETKVTTTADDDDDNNKLLRGISVAVGMIISLPYHMNTINAKCEWCANNMLPISQSGGAHNSQAEPPEPSRRRNGKRAVVGFKFKNT